MLYILSILILVLPLLINHLLAKLSVVEVVLQFPEKLSLPPAVQQAVEGHQVVSSQFLLSLDGAATHKRIQPHVRRLKSGEYWPRPCVKVHLLFRGVKSECSLGTRGEPLPVFSIQEIIYQWVWLRNQVV